MQQLYRLQPSFRRARSAAARARLRRTWRRPVMRRGGILEENPCRGKAAARGRMEAGPERARPGRQLPGRASSPKEETMPEEKAELSLAELPDGGSRLVQRDGEPVLVVRRGEEVFAIGATCSHYGGPLAEGVVVGDTVRCPWHHACFSLRTGEAVRAPALNPVACYAVERSGDRITIGEKIGEKIGKPPERQASGPDPILIVGAGAAGNAAAEALRRAGYPGT